MKDHRLQVVIACGLRTQGQQYAEAASQEKKLRLIDIGGGDWRGQLNEMCNNGYLARSGSYRRRAKIGDMIWIVKHSQTLLMNALIAVIARYGVIF